MRFGSWVASATCFRFAEATVFAGFSLVVRNTLSQLHKLCKNSAIVCVLLFEVLKVTALVCDYVVVCVLLAFF